ncbi:glycosyltransferase family 2 protein [Prevotella sp. OH937_COT-195]|uniref:glycosyltransferase family 2 protein n=1 Tax=Prevotella sp. OH937_COT-195 TaxID=2491051 RepID=UPI000F64CB8E|nr:glycosyltransferase [Prevotella sp. OH937_COT-195]RRD00894.1 glycosyltransferase [Prevotella sp. OH937_COT-195]
MPNNIYATEQTPLVSFIVTTYNLPDEMLKECLQSITALSLNHREVEIIVVDDGSDEDTLSGIREICDNIIYIRQPNKGVSVARNMGLKIASGKYIQFIDGDDKLILAGYEHCLDIVRFKDPDIVLFNFTKKDTNIDTPYMFDGPLSGEEYMRRNNIKASVCGYVFSRNILANLKFSAGVEFGEDEEFTPQLILSAEKLYATDTCAYYYRKNSSSVTHKKGKRRLAKRLADTEHVIYNLYHLAGTLPAQDSAALRRRVAQLTMDYIYNTIVLTRSRHQLEKRIRNLEKKGLYPLPSDNYTWKYKIFNKMIKSDTGKKVLMLALPLLKRER